MAELDEFCIVETESGSLPEHWSHIGRTNDGCRIMKTFETETKAEDYLQEMYGMYRDDGTVVATEDLELSH